MEGVRWDNLEKDLRSNRKFKDFLRRRYGKSTKSEIYYEAEKIVRGMQEGRISPNIWVLENKVIPNIEDKNPDRAELFRIVLEVIKREEDCYGLSSSPPSSESEEETERQVEKTSEEIRGVIGRVALTRKTPATPYRFTFWVKHDASVHVEPGELVYVDLEGDDYALAVVERAEAQTDVLDPITHFYSWSFGNPHEAMPTEVPVIRACEASIVYRSGNRSNAPFTVPYEVHKSEAKHLEEAFCKMIEEKHRVLLGFVRDGYGTLVPVFGDFRFTFGYRAGHVNITGKSGVAGKTSYALFLIASVLGAKKGKEDQKFDLSVIAFNVKERDLLTIRDIVNPETGEKYDDLETLLRDNEENGWLSGEDLAMWEKVKELGIDPVEVFREAVIYEPLTRREGVSSFSYGLQDLLDRGVHVLLALFDPMDVDEKMESLVYSIEEDYHDGRSSFSDLVKGLRAKIEKKEKGGVELGGIYHFTATVQKFLNRLNKILHATRVLEIDKPKGSPVEVGELRSGEMWVIDVKPLRDNEKRMVFLSVLNDLDIILEAKKEKNFNCELCGDSIEIVDFPSRVAVFVDELNKFAPAGRYPSAVKTFIVDVASRGRSIGLTLIGAEQFASQVDEEVIGNTSTYLIGKTEEVELSFKFYKRVPGGLKERIPYLKTGELVLVHEAHSASVPLVIRYPKPLHKVSE